jgi:DNA-binding HxlR family transcriptional regulator
MLAERLRDLEAAGLIQRRVLADQSPPAVEYRLTPRGEALAPVIEAVRDYACRGPR